MLILAATLSLVMGLVLGLLGGGGSILTVPILLYAIGLGAKEAIATSLLVVAMTSLVGAARHAHGGNVCWRTGLVFGGVAMIGAYAGGLVAGYISGTTLLLVFIALMAVTGAAMLRTRSTSSAPRSPRRFALGKLAAEGLVVGAITGLVGAGGGFLVVPALVLLGGMGMRTAIGTSLLVISMKSFAGLAGHLTHVSIDPVLALVVTGAAVIGTLLGANLSERVRPESLRRGFALFVLAMAGFMAYREAPPGVYEAVFVDRWPFWAGGTAIAAFVLAFLLIGRKALGVSTGFMDACAAPFDAGARRSWRLPFMGGIILGGLLAAVLGGGFVATTSMGMFDVLLSASVPVKALVFTGGGVMVGFGARLAGGCTSGHGIVGTAQLAPSSLIATGAFMIAGFGVTNALLGA